MRTIAIIAISVVCSVAAIGIIELLVYGPDIGENVAVISGEKLQNKYGEEIGKQNYILIPILLDDIKGMNPKSTESNGYVMQYREDPTYISECTRLVEEIDEYKIKKYSLRGEEQVTHNHETADLLDVWSYVCGFAGVGPAKITNLSP